MVDFARSHPGVVVYVKPRRHRSPMLVAEYRKKIQKLNPACSPIISNTGFDFV